MSELLKAKFLCLEMNCSFWSTLIYLSVITDKNCLESQELLRS